MLKRAFYEPIWQWYEMLVEYEVRRQNTHIGAPFLPPPTIRQFLPWGPLFSFTTTKTVSSGTEMRTSQYVVNNTESEIEQKTTHYEKSISI